MIYRLICTEMEVATMLLRSKLIRLAHANPQLRPDLLPLLVKQAGPTSPARTPQVISKAIRSAPFGKKVGGDLYVHKNSFDKGSFDPVLVEMLAEATKVGAPSQYTILKFSPKNGGMVSFVHYPTFDTEGHPGIESYLTVTLDTGKVSTGKYGNPDKAWILHRKETMVDPGYPNRSMFEALTRAEEKEGLLRRPPGKREAWKKLLSDQGYEIEGHDMRKVI